MTTHTCDCCGKTIDEPGRASLPAISFEFRIPGKIFPRNVTYGIGQAYKDGEYSVRFTSIPIFPKYGDDEHPEDLCRDCVLKAFKEAVAKLT